MAITVSEENEFFKLIYHPFCEHINLLDSYFAGFNRLLSISIYDEHFDDISAGLSMISKVSFRFDLLKIGKYDLCKLAKFYRDNEVNFTLQNLYIDN